MESFASSPSTLIQHLKFNQDQRREAKPHRCSNKHDLQDMLASAFAFLAAIDAREKGNIPIIADSIAEHLPDWVHAVLLFFNKFWIQ
jgi:hypothetical protein